MAEYRRFPQAPTDQRIEDLTGQRFGHLLALRPYSQRNASGKLCWICRCDCGIEVACASTDLKAGNARTCGSRACPFRGKK